MITLIDAGRVVDDEKPLYQLIRSKVQRSKVQVLRFRQQRQLFLKRSKVQLLRFRQQRQLFLKRSKVQVLRFRQQRQQRYPLVYSYCIS
ncbi:hypothetical protein RCL_jg4970.t1 [Rhizophagus clarus]|uniref:Uncharacterized protein n=1 Tax=Rhizophagus clarus TaxID=94130 RepID=A0A8H3L808_9GLOM|nr:hypothetical protein RCL_jg4970.t1 [Rhizophagus clarus]